MGTAGWHSIDPTYDAARLVADTLAFLGPDTPVLVRMETLRRATIYASTDPKIANALLSALKERASMPRAKVGINVFDFGYLVETYRQGSSTTKAESRGHLEQAKAHADSDRTLALNISTHFQ